jgi:hypothetical protein
MEHHEPSIPTTDMDDDGQRQNGDRVRVRVSERVRESE